MNDFLSIYPLHAQRPMAADVGRAIPADLKAMLNVVQANSYADGFFQFVPPDAFAHYFSLWQLAPEDCHAFLKCGFGHLIFFHEDQYKALNPVFNDIDVLGDADSLEFVMDILLCDRTGMENSFLLDVYEAACPRLGAPAADQIYAFIPALGLGGPRSPDHVELRPMRIEMPILAQL